MHEDLEGYHQQKHEERNKVVVDDQRVADVYKELI